MIRFDAKTKTLTLSVRDLAGDSAPRFGGGSPLPLAQRAAVGRLEHEAHQGAREEELRSYRRERTIRFETRLEGWTVVVTGRIDGVYSDGSGRTVVEEVKTVVGSVEVLEAATEATYPAYTRQLQLYRYLLEESTGALGFGAGEAPEIALHLCLIALPSRQQRTLEVGYERGACGALVERRLREVWAEEEARAASAERRREVAEAVCFPHAEPRPSQEEIVAVVEEGLALGRPVMVSAPPGTGKTAAALVPALRHALRVGGRVFVATSKTTQQAIFARTVELLREAGAPVRAVVLQARAKGCLNEVVHCHPDVCRFAKDYADKLEASGALGRLEAEGVARPERLREEGSAGGFCPVEAGLDLAREVEVVIGDYNYAFDPSAVLKRLFVDGDPEEVVLVVDEAHNLYDRGRGYYSPSLGREELEGWASALRGLGGRTAVEAAVWAERLAHYLAAVDAGEGAPLPEPEPQPVSGPENLLLFGGLEASAPAVEPAPARVVRTRGVATRGVKGAPRLPEREVEVDEGVFSEARDALGELALAWYAEGGARAAREAGDDPLSELQRSVQRFTGVLEQAGEEFSVVWRRRDGGVLTLLCKDPARLLGRRIRSCGGAVAISATLEPLEFYRDVLGFGEGAVLRAFDSPFDPRKRKVIVLDRPSTVYRERERDLPIVEDAVRAVLASRAGNYLVCCPSFDYLRQLYGRLEDMPGFEVLRQERVMPEVERAAVLARLEASARGEGLPVVLLVVQGGIFTEGVDYPGELCVGAIVVGPGLPAVGFERELIRTHFQRVYGRGFEYAFLYPGMNRVLQAAGRVIRTTTDVGVVVLVGNRFATPRYFQLFPPDWYEEHPRELICGDPYTELTLFWAGQKG